MSFPVIGTFCRIEFFYQSALGKLMSGQLYFTTLDVFIGGFDIAAWAAALDAYVEAPLMACCPTTVKYLGSVSTLYAAGVVRGYESYSTSIGAVTSPVMPDDVAVVVQRLSTIGGKSGRGRLFIGCLPDTFIAGNRLNTTGVTAFTALVTAFKAPFSTQSQIWSPAIWSKKLAAFHAAVDWTFDANTATQRHRRPRF